MRNWVGGVVGLTLGVACGGSTPPGSTSDPAGDTGRSANVTLTITVSGQGSVRAAGQSIACAATCAQPLLAGSAVQLAATPAAGMRFTGWSGACSGAGGCALTLAQDTPVGARFEAEDPCAGLMPKLPAAQTFLSPGYGSDGSCGSATTDGMGTVYSVENGRGGGIYSNAGGIVKSENLFVPLASGFSTFPQGMMATGTISARRPDGTLASLGSLVSDRYVIVFAGEQANGGSVIVAVNPGVDCSKTNDLQIIHFDDHFAKASDVHVLNRGCTPGYGSEENDILVDAQDRTLMVYVAQGGDIHGVPAGHYGAGWFDPAGKALTDWFDAGASHQGSLLVGPVLVPLIGGGAALRSASGWVTVPSGAARIDPAPAGFTPGKIPHIVLGGRAYAMTDLRSFSTDQSPSTVEVVEPGGKSCGVLTTAPATGEYFTIGKDGTLLTVANTAGASGRLDMCTTTYYPRVLE